MKEKKVSKLINHILITKSCNVGYQFPTKLLKLFLPSYNYLRYLYYMHILLMLWNMLSKFT
jgi:hypothetical protein